ncbi:MAG: iron ABC transporter permease [Flavobacteriia bacterium]|nr:iron ABC transporter permease [Flavobacteriia bacterium]
MKRQSIVLLIVAILIFFFLFHLFYGNFELFKSFFSSHNYSKIIEEKWLITKEIRFPRTIISVFAGSGLAVAGLLLQTFFNNELAGPSVLGITSGASLFISLSVFTGFTFFQESNGLFLSALTGSAFVCLIILFFSTYLKNKISLLLLGIMLGSFINSFIQILEIKSSEINIKLYTFWGLGSLQHFDVSNIFMISIVFFCCIILLFFLIKPLNLLLLGEKELILNGYSFLRIKWLVILISSTLTAVITAYCGPIAFIGLAVPNICRLIFRTSSHSTLLLFSALLGSLFLIFCDSLVLMFENWILLPINAITSLFGAPIVIWILLKKW